MKKTFITAVVASLLLMSPLAKADNIKVVVNGEQLTFDQPPIIINDRTMVPMRAIFEKLGAMIDWNGAAQTITAVKGDTTISIKIGDTFFLKNSQCIIVDTPAQIVNDRTLVPIRAVSELLDCAVNWDNATKTVTISSDKTSIATGDLYYESGKLFYSGDVLNGKAHGNGIMYYEDTQTPAYIGDFVDGKFCGEGTMYNTQGGILAQGTFKNDTMNGMCYVYDSEDGSVIYGNFVDGKIDSIGAVHLDQNGKLIYEGQFDEKMQYSGKGTLYYPNSDKVQYVGDFQNGLMNGYGTWYSNDNTGYYVGGFKDNHFYGKGQVYDANGNLLGNVIADENGTLNNDTSYAQPTQQSLTDAYYEELNTLNEWKKQKLEELYEFSMSDPFSYDWAQDILEEYGVADFNENDDNVDSYSAANKKRQQQAYLNSANQVILATFESKIKNQQKLIEEQYNYELNALKQKYNIK